MERMTIDAAAACIGPTAAEISGGADVDERVLEHWDARSGYLKDPELLNAGGVDKLMAEDLARF